MGVQQDPTDNRLLSAQVLNAVNTDPQNSVFIGPEDSLVLYAYSSVAANIIQVNVKLLLPNGSIAISSYQFTMNATRFATAFVVPAGQGLMLSASISGFTGFAWRRGMCYATLTLIRGGTFLANTVTQPIVSGYVTQSSYLQYPPGDYDPALSGQGNIRSITGTTPAAGAEISETVPAGAVWQLLSFRSSLTTSVTVATRVPIITLDDGSNILAELTSGLTQPANIVIFYNFAVGYGNLTPFSNRSLAPIPSPFYLTQLSRIRSVTSSLQAGDQWTAPQYVVMEWLQP